MKKGLNIITLDLRKWGFGMYDIIIIGAGGFGREVYNWAKESFPSKKFRIKGFLSNNANDLDDFDFNVGILGDENTYKIKKQDRFLIAIGNIDIKKKVVAKLKKKGAQFLTLIHPTAIVSKTAKIGQGVIICPFAIVSDHVIVEDFVLLNFYSSCGHDAKVGKYCVLSPYATLNGFAVLEDEVFLGTHSTVTPKTKIGYRSKISANSVAMHNIPAYSFVFGVPGKHKVIFKE